MWAIVNNYWMDIKRLEDLPFSLEEAVWGWKPTFRLHCNLIEVIFNRKGEHDIIVNHKPPKTDPTEMYQNKPFFAEAGERTT